MVNSNFDSLNNIIVHNKEKKHYWLFSNYLIRINYLIRKIVILRFGVLCEHYSNIYQIP